MPRDIFIEIYIPNSMAVIDGRSPTCFKGAVVSGSQFLKCSIIAEKTIKIENICFPNGCNANTIL